MKLFPHIVQGSDEWRQLRAEYFTASALGEWLIEEPKLDMTVAQIQEALTKEAITFKKSDLRPALVELLPNEVFLANLKYTKDRDNAWQNAIESRLGRISEEEEPEWDTWATKRGKTLEPDARFAYEARTGLSTVQVGFCAHDSDDFGGSPDALALTLPIDAVPPLLTDEQARKLFTNGVELKCHIPRTHIRFLRRGGFREEHAIQVHASMASTGLREWHLFGYCPDLPPLFEVFRWDETTDKVLAALLRLSEDYWAAHSELKDMWRQNQSEALHQPA